jgi:hypothetical protein
MFLVRIGLHQKITVIIIRAKFKMQLYQQNNYSLVRHCRMQIVRLMIILGMVRTMLSFSAIHILLSIITFVCGLYSIREYRYTYKRLTGMLYVLTGEIRLSINRSTFLL